MFLRSRSILRLLCAVLAAYSLAACKPEAGGGEQTKARDLAAKAGVSERPGQIPNPFADDLPTLPPSLPGTSSVNAPDFLLGFNQAWIFNRYSTQWGRDFDFSEFKRAIRITKEANGNILRLWLFEGYVSDALIWSNGRVTGLNPVFVTNLKRVLAEAKSQGVMLNLTLFDAIMSQGAPPSTEIKNFWWNLLNDKYGVRQDFIRDVYKPLLEILALPEYNGVVLQIDLANEIDALIYFFKYVRFTNDWTGANKMVCEFYNAKNSVPGAAKLQFTASVGWFLPTATILNGQPWADCVDFFDFHIYNDGGDIPGCASLVSYARAKGKKIQLGEFGQSSGALNDAQQATVTRNFLNNAKSCGLDGAMAWRLLEWENNAHLSYEKDGSLRPAYYEFKKFSP